MPSGYLYVLSNASMPGLLKIGRTDRQPELRARELRSTGVPTPFTLEHYVQVADSAIAERQVHEELQSKGSRMSPDREFFNVSLNDAIEVLELVSTALPAKPDFSLGPELARMAATLTVPSRKDGDPDEIEAAASQLAAIARRGYSQAMRQAADLFEYLYPSGPRFKDLFREYLALTRTEATRHPLASSIGREVRMAVGRAAAEYIFFCCKHKWITEDDFSFISRFLVNGDQFQYEGYLNELSRYPLSDESAARARDV